jgi:hypothetical protein
MIITRTATLFIARVRHLVPWQMHMRVRGGGLGGFNTFNQLNRNNHGFVYSYASALRCGGVLPVNARCK